MANKLIDIYDRILEYNNYKQALKLNIQKRDMLQLKNIIKNYKSLYTNVQGHTKFLNESGLYALILRSKKNNAIKIFDWIVHDVMPSLKKYGKYELNEKNKKQFKKLHNKITSLRNKMAVVKHNLRSPIVPKGKVIYVLRLIEDDIKFSRTKIYFLKFGRSRKMTQRINNYNTASKNKVQVIRVISVKKLIRIENCISKGMSDYLIQNKKEYVESSYNVLIKQIIHCIKKYDNKIISDEPDLYNKLNKKLYSCEQNIDEQKLINDFDPNEIAVVKIIDDKMFDKMFPNIDHNNNKNKQMTGGGKYFEYLNLKSKYLKLKNLHNKLEYLEFKYSLINGNQV